MEATKFNEKFNKLDGNIYVVEEVVTLTNGVYDAELEHDNVDLKTINIYTGSKLTGSPVTFLSSTPSLTPWKTIIKVNSTTSPLYISYETSGDTVEAEDINKVQDAIVNTQNNLNTEINRASDTETTLTTNINSEISRAKSAENIISNNLTTEITRAENAESTLTTNLDSEISRAKSAESTLTDNLSTEIKRAEDVESTLTTNLNSEISRSKSVESTLTSDLSAEVTRAKGAESTLTDNLATEISRACSAESTLSDNLSTETTRAKEAENTINNTISTNKSTWDDKYTKNEVENKLSALVTSLDYKEHVSTFSDIATTYPTPEEGWTVCVDADNITYRYNGTVWEGISANSIPLATSSVSGLMSMADKTNHDDMNIKKHTHDNKSIIDTITQTLINTWNSAYTHISDTVKHITATERTLWNTVTNKSDSGHTHDDRYYTETESDNKFATKDQIATAGQGDMLKSVYDTNGDGIVNNADMLDGKHASVTPATTEKNDLVGMINELFTSVSNGKNTIYSAITGKGITPASKNFADLTTGINNIPKGQGQGNAVEAQVLNGITFTNSDGTLRTGTMPDMSHWGVPDGFGGNNYPLLVNVDSGDITIPEGYHSGKGSIVTACYKVPNGATVTPSTTDQSVGEQTWYGKPVVVKGDANLVPANIISGKSIFGVSGSAPRYSEGSFTANNASSINIGINFRPRIISVEALCPTTVSNNGKIILTYNSIIASYTNAMPYMYASTSSPLGEPLYTRTSFVITDSSFTTYLPSQCPSGTWKAWE